MTERGHHNNPPPHHYNSGGARRVWKSDKEEAVRGRCEGGPRLKLDTGSRGRCRGGGARARVPEHKPVWPV